MFFFVFDRFTQFTSSDAKYLYLLSANLDAQIVHMTAFNSTSGATTWRSPSFPIPVAPPSSSLRELTRFDGVGLMDDNITDDGNATVDDNPAPSDDDKTDDSTNVVPLVTCSEYGIIPTESSVVFTCVQVGPSPLHEGNFIVSLRASDGKTEWIADL